MRFELDDSAFDAGDRLTETNRINPHDILRILGEEAAAQSLLDEIQRCFQHQQIDVDDKHFELIIQRMLSRAEVTSPGETDFMVGQLVSREVWQQRANELIAQGQRPPMSQTTHPATVALRLTNIDHSLPANGWSRLLPGFTSWDGLALACAALSGVTNPVDCVADRAVLGTELG